MKGKFTLLALAMTALSLNAQSTLKVLSYNIHHGAGMDGKLDFQRIAEVIKKEKPDLVALQEVDQKTARINGIDAVATLSNLTGLKYSYFSKSISFGGGDYGNTILSNRPLEKPFTNKLPGSEARSVAGAIVKVDGKQLLFLCTHFSLQEKNALKSVQIIHDIYREHRLPTILVGDFNIIPKSPATKNILKSFKMSELKNQPTSPADKPKNKIDYIFNTKEFTVKSAKVINEPVASDHRPLTATLYFK